MGNRIAKSKRGQTEGYNKALYRNLVTDLLGYEKITTSESKARRIRGLAEKIITMGKQGTLHSRRLALAVLFDEEVADKVFGDLAKRYADRHGGYTRVVKLGPRVGDGTPMVQLELVK